VEQWKENITRHRKLTELTEQRYTQGLVGQINYLTTQQQLITAEQNLLQSNTKSLIDLIALYKALGGGWQVGEVSATN
jgi:outer membrane protein TolC